MDHCLELLVIFASDSIFNELGDDVILEEIENKTKRQKWENGRINTRTSCQRQQRK